MTKRILIVDDDLDFCFELSEALRADGYSVKTISDAKKAETQIKKNAYEIIILDYKMPKISGDEILKFIRDKRLKAKVFLTTGKPFIENILEAKGLIGIVSDFLNKPFKIETLLEKIKAL